LIHLVTLNPALDLELELSEPRYGKVGTLLSQKLTAGGKALNVARFLSENRVSSRVWLGCGGREDPTHLLFRSLLRAEKVSFKVETSVSKVPVRFNLHCKEKKRFRKYNHPGFPQTVSDLRAFHRRIHGAVKTGDLLVLTGKLPKGVDAHLYGKWIQSFQSVGIPVVLDTSGEPLKIALESRPAFFKINRFEAEEALGRRFRDRNGFRGQVLSFIKRGLSQGAITDGARGAVLWEGSQACFVKPRYPVDLQAVVGAGDGFLAGWLASMICGESFEQRARRSVASGWAVAKQGIFNYTRSCASARRREISLRRILL